ncbi:hypothetical protein OG394_27345 [Kribbella sp. NBC_01245]|uniref:hypothetical protein n=1 Tax=Kribbella sp. NBC_01245 TaxID=2903578 RepID=UPI002E2976C4|nr:hypothetical protein [Kribbella sp. NBC_01245]
MKFSQGGAVRRIAGSAVAVGLCLTAAGIAPAANASGSAGGPDKPVGAIKQDRPVNTATPIANNSAKTGGTLKVVGPLTTAGPIVSSGPSTTAGSVKAAVNLTGPTSGTYNTNVRFSGTLWRYGTPTKIAGATVVIQRTPHNGSSWINLTSAKTTSTGTFAFGVTLTGAYDYRAYYAGSTTYTTALSGKVYPAVLRGVAFDSIKTTNQGDGNRVGVLTATGRAYPVVPTGSPIYLQRYDAAGKAWKSIGTVASRGTANFTISAKVGGSVAPYRFHVPLKYPIAAGSSRSVTFAHYVWRGAYWKPVLASGGTGDPWYEIFPASEWPTRAGAYFGAESIGGTSWIDVNTSGCVSIQLTPKNYSDEQEPTTEQFTMRGINGEILAGKQLAPGQEVTFYEILLNGLTRTRLQVSDVGGTAEPMLLVATWVRCNN